MEAKSRFPEANQRLICPKPRSLNPSQTLINVLAVLPHCEFMSHGPTSDPRITLFLLLLLLTPVYFSVCRFAASATC